MARSNSATSCGFRRSEVFRKCRPAQSPLAIGWTMRPIWIGKSIASTICATKLRWIASEIRKQDSSASDAHQRRGTDGQTDHVGAGLLEGRPKRSISSARRSTRIGISATFGATISDLHLIAASTFCAAPASSVRGGRRRFRADRRSITANLRRTQRRKKTQALALEHRRGGRQSGRLLVVASACSRARSRRDRPLGSRRTPFMPIGRHQDVRRNAAAESDPGTSRATDSPCGPSFTIVRRWF